jgi:serine/threonine protein kinase
MSFVRGLLPMSFSLPERYELMKQLGEGGMGTVYLAKDNELDRMVALKLLKPAIVSEEALLRFADEARVCSQLSHKHVVSLYDFDDSKEHPFMVFEYVEGSDFRQALINGGPQEKLLEYMLQACLGVEAAHHLGVIHRDLKPDNILLANGQAKIADFGLAKLAGVTSVKTKTGVLLGTPQYMSPEQVMGQEITSATDVYALACVIYEVFEGTPPFMSDDAGSILNARVKQDVPRISSGSIRFQDFLAKCLAKSPNERPTVSELVEELSTLLSGGLTKPSRPRSKEVAPTLLIGKKEKQRGLGQNGSRIAVVLLVACLFVFFVSSNFNEPTKIKLNPVEFDGQSCIFKGKTAPNKPVNCTYSQSSKGPKGLQSRSDENGSFVFKLRGLEREEPVRVSVTSDAAQKAIAFTPPPIEVSSWILLRGGPNFVQLRAKMSVPARWRIVLFNPKDEEQLSSRVLREKSSLIDEQIGFRMPVTPHELTLAIMLDKTEVVRQNVSTGFRKVSPLILLKDIETDTFRIMTKLVATDQQLVVVDSGGFILGFSQKALDVPPFEDTTPTWLKALPLLKNGQHPTAATIPVRDKDVSLLYLTKVLDGQCLVKYMSFTPSQMLEELKKERPLYTRNGSLLRNNKLLTEFARHEKTVRLPYLLSPLAEAVGDSVYVLCDGPSGRQALVAYDVKKEKTISHTELPRMSGTRFTLSEKFCAVLGERKGKGHLCIYDKMTMRLIRIVLLNGDTNDHVPFIAKKWVIAGHSAGVTGVHVEDEGKDWKYEGSSITCNFIPYGDRIYTVELSRMLQSQLLCFSLSGEREDLKNSKLPTLGLRKFPMIKRFSDTLIVCCEATCFGLQLPKGNIVWQVSSPANLSRHAPSIVSNNSLYAASKRGVWRLCLPSLLN